MKEVSRRGLRFSVRTLPRAGKPRTRHHSCRRRLRLPRTALGMGTRVAQAGPETSDISCYII